MKKLFVLFLLLLFAVPSHATFPGLWAVSHGAPLPTTNLTLHFDPSDSTTTWKTATSGNNPCYTVQATVNGDTVQVMNTILPAPTSDIVFVFPSTTNQSPTLSTSVMARSSLHYDGVNDELDSFNRSCTSPANQATYMSANARTVVFAARFHSTSLNSGNSYQNAEIIGDGSGFWGVYLKNNSGAYTLLGYNWDGNDDHADQSVSVDTNYVVAYVADGSTVKISVNGGTQQSAASGTTSTFAGVRILTGNAGLPAEWYLGEALFYNAALTGSDLSAAIAYLQARWP